MTDQTAAPRPVPTTEDRMRDARTDTAFHRFGQQAAAVIQPAASFATYLDRTERDQLDARAACAEQERDDARDDRDHWRRELDKLHEAYARATTDREQARAEAANLRQQLDRANTGRQKLQEQLDTQTAVAQSNKRHVAYLTTVIEAIANVEPHIHNGDATEDNCSPYCPGCRIRTAMNATPPSSVPPRRAQEDQRARSETGCMGDPDEELRLAGVHPDQDPAADQALRDRVEHAIRARLDTAFPNFSRVALDQVAAVAAVAAVDTLREG